MSDNTPIRRTIDRVPASLVKAARAFQARLAVTRNQEAVQEDLVALVKRRVPGKRSR